MAVYIKVTIDRPMGYVDKYGNTYPLNYGFVPDVIGGDGEEQDVYVLDVQEPIDEYEGRVIAIVHRRDDIETKWVVSNSAATLAEITEKVNFLEQYFDSYIEMLD